MYIFALEIMNRFVAFISTLLCVVAGSSMVLGQKTHAHIILGKHMDDVDAVCVSPNDQYIATGSWDKTVQIYSGDSLFTYKQTLEGHNAAVSAMAFSRDASLLVTGGKDYMIIVWAKNSKGRFERQETYQMVHTAAINTIEVGPEGNMVYSGGDDGNIVVRNRRSNSQWVIQNNHPVNDIALRGKTYFLCADETPVVKLYSLAGTVIKNYKGHTDVVNAIACNAQYIVTGSSDKTAIVWDALSGKQLRVLSGHAWKINSVEISADGKYVVTGSNDGQTKIWDIETGEEYKSFVEIAAMVRQVSLSRNMKYVFSAFQIDTVTNDPVYGLSVHRTGLEYDYKTYGAKHTVATKYPVYSKPQTSNGSVTPVPYKAQVKPVPAKVNTNQEVITETEEIQITIEDE